MISSQQYDYSSQRENSSICLASSFGPYEKVCTFSFLGGWRTKVMMKSGALLRMGMVLAKGYMMSLTEVLT